MKEVGTGQKHGTSVLLMCVSTSFSREAQAAYSGQADRTVIDTSLKNLLGQREYVYQVCFQNNTTMQKLDLRKSH